MQNSLASSSSISLATTLAVESSDGSQGPQSLTYIPSHVVKSNQHLDPGPFRVDHNISSADVLKYNGAGRFWRPLDASDKKGGRFRGRKKRSDIDAGKYHSRSPYADSRKSEGKQLENGIYAPPRRGSAEHPIFEITRLSSLSDGSVSALSLPSEPTRNPSDYKLRRETSKDSTEERARSLAQEIAINERKSRTREHLIKLQHDEEERLEQMDRDESLSAYTETLNLTRNLNNAGDQSYKNLLLTPQYSFTSRVPISQPLTDLDIEIRLPSRERPECWNKRCELDDTRLVNVMELEDRATELSSKHCVSELADNYSSLDPSNEDSLFSDLNSIVGALRKKSNVLSVPPQRARALSISSLKESKHDWSSRHAYSTPFTNPHPNTFELSPQSRPSEPPPNVFELSSSNSVIHRPSQRRKPLPRPHSQARQHSDLVTYNTLPHESFPIRRKELCSELPAINYDDEKAVPRSGARISIEPLVDPRTSRVWVGT